MKGRDVNRRVLSVFVLATVTAVIISWTLSEKFIADARIALAVSLVLAMAIGMLYSRYLENKINASVDYLMSKISRVSQGDLTQVFKEDPDDILPYGLSYELGKMMINFRENINSMRKTSSHLGMQLSFFLQFSQEIQTEFEREAASLSAIRRDMEKVRRSTGEMITHLSGAKVNSNSDIVLMMQTSKTANDLVGSSAKSKALMKSACESTESFRKQIDKLEDMTKKLGNFSETSNFIRRSLSDLVGEINLVKMNAAIDATRSDMNVGSYAQLVDETKLIVERISALSQGGSGSNEEETMGKLMAEVNGYKMELSAACDVTAIVLRHIIDISETACVSEAEFSSVLNHVQNLNGLMNQFDESVSQFAEIIKISENTYDKLDSDARITLLKFSELGSRIEDIKANLKKLDEFNQVFDIA